MTFPLLQDIRHSSIDVQFVDEHRIFGVSHGLDPGSPQLVTLLDTSTSAKNAQEPREIVFELGNLEGPVSLIEGTHAQGASETREIAFLPLFQSFSVRKGEKREKYILIEAIIRKGGMPLIS